MPEVTVQAMDPLGVVALAHVLQIEERWEDPKCPSNCGCNPMCGCEAHPGCCENKCPCEKKDPMSDILATVSNPVFREVVQGLDLSRVKSINDFLSIVGDIRAKMPSTRQPGGSTSTK